MFVMTLYVTSIIVSGTPLRCTGFKYASVLENPYQASQVYNILPVCGLWRQCQAAHYHLRYANYWNRLSDDHFQFSAFPFQLSAFPFQLSAFHSSFPFHPFPLASRSRVWWCQLLQEPEWYATRCIQQQCLHEASFMFQRAQVWTEALSMQLVTSLIPRPLADFQRFPRKMLP